MGIPLLNDILVIFLLSIVVVFICTRFHIPAVVGFLLTGVIAGPHGLKFVHAVREVNTLAEIGVILLVFTTGIEFSFRNLLRIKKAALLGGFLQVFLTALTIFLIARSLGQSRNLSIFLGLLLCHTSTVIMLKLLSMRNEVDSPHGRTSLGISLFQDISCVPMMLAVPLLAGATAKGAIGSSLLLLGAKGVGIISLVFIGAVWIVPWVLYQIVRTRSYELFLLAIVTVCFAVTWLTSNAGLSLALGAFLAGLVISECEYSQQALGNVLPFRDVFASFFFISVGMLLDLRFVFVQPLFIVCITLSILTVKALIAALVALLIGLPLRSAIFTGVLLCQVGEFSFILAQTGIPYHLLDPNTYQLLLSVVVLTMVIAPFSMILVPHMVRFAAHLPLPHKMKGTDIVKDPDTAARKKDHLIIVGFGINGRNLARACRASGIPYTVLEMNAETVKKEKARGEPIFYGDATQETVLNHVGVKEARVMTVAISDPEGSRRITQSAHNLNPNLYIIARTRYIQEMAALYKLGANDVIPEELETSVEMFVRVLRKYLIPNEDIARFVAEIRSGNYEMLRDIAPEAMPFSTLQLSLSDIEISVLRLSGLSPFSNKTLAETELRKRYGVTVLAIRQGSLLIPNPDGNTSLQAGDILVMMGSPAKIFVVTKLLYPEKDLARESQDPIGN